MSREPVLKALPIGVAVIAASHQERLSRLCSGLVQPVEAIESLLIRQINPRNYLHYRSKTTTG